MSPLLYLIPSEKKLFDELPAKLKSEWGGKVVEEKGTAWETDEQLVWRAKYAQKEMPPKIKLAMQKMFVNDGNKEIAEIPARDFPREALPYVFLSLGAVGLTGVVSTLLSAACSAQELGAIEECSAARHRILLANSLTSPAFHGSR